MNWHQNIFKELKIVLKYSTLVFTYFHTCFRDVQYIRLIMFFNQIVFISVLSVCISVFVLLDWISWGLF